MKTFFGLPERMITALPPVLTVGMFDGLHRGHQEVLKEVKRQAEERGAPAVVLTFDHHPRKVVTPGETPPMITSLEHRLALFAEAGMDVVVVLPFTDDLAAMEGAFFIQEIMVNRLQMQAVVLGHDTHFGRNRSGNIRLLNALSETFPFQVTGIPALQLDGVTVSSTLIRERVLSGDLASAERMLGHPVTVMGTVIHGRGFGRELGFPTLNLDLHHELHPPQGVYFTCTRIGDSQWPSATFIGDRPANRLVTGKAVIIESHLLTGSVGDLYGTVATVSFLHHERPVQQFESVQRLQQAIQKDIAAALVYHGIVAG